VIRQAVAPAYGGKSDILLHDLGTFSQQILVQQFHQKIEFGFGTLPVFATEAIKRQLTQSETTTFFNRHADTLYSTAMALDPGQAAQVGPAAIAVHDYGNMSRHEGRIDSGFGQALQGRLVKSTGH